MSTSADRARELIDLATGLVEPGPLVDELRSLRARLDEPLRVAIAGRAKAGKSTLLNALIGERLAADRCGRVHANRHLV